MDYAFCFAPCFLCGQPFSFNPHKVPSIKDRDGVRQPICEPCLGVANKLRAEKGLPAWAPALPGAYDPIPEEEL